LDVVTFDCEATTDNQRLCAHVGVEHYPSVLFVGYGSYRRNDFMRNKMLGKKVVPERTVMYTGELYFESVRDWCRAMRFFSRLSRVFGRAARMLGYVKDNEREESARLDAIRAENAALKASAAEAAAEAAAETKRKAGMSEQSARLTKQYGTKGDAFRFLSEHGYGIAESGSSPETALAGTHEATIFNVSISALRAVRLCVAEVTAQHCERQGEARAEPFCSKIKACALADFESLECRPATCPLHPDGCDFASICLNAEIIKAYEDTAKKDHINKAAKGPLRAPGGGSTYSSRAPRKRSLWGDSGGAGVVPGGASNAVPAAPVITEEGNGKAGGSGNKSAAAPTSDVEE
jgi:hypothetical protein